MKVAVLLSGGLDSSTCLAQAVKMHGSDSVFALNIQYGQKHQREIRSAADIARHYGGSTQLLDLSGIFAHSQSALLRHSENSIVHASYSEQLKALGGSGTVSTYVPFRNGIMLSAAAACAQSLGASEVWYGAHRDDAAGRAYPDCTPEFVAAMNTAIYEGTGHEVRLYAPFISMNKADIVKLGLELKVPYELTWSCYEGGDRPCGKCGTCIDRLEAFHRNGVRDPLETPEEV